LNEPSTFEQLVIENCQELKLFPEDSKVLLALSGGADSTALFHVLNRLASKLKITLGVAHLNHQTRGEESDKDSEFVQALAKEHDLPCHIKSKNVKAWVESEGYSFQEGARVYRQIFLCEVAEKNHYSTIALGHHQDDQAETVLMNILRGSGLNGLGGMLVKRKAFVRPLLNCSRQEILDYLDSQGAAFRQDASNQDVSYLRNKIRLELIPEIENSFAPRFKSQLGKMSQLLQEDESYLFEEAQNLFQEVGQITEKGLTLPVDKLRGLHPAILNRVLRFGIHEIKGNLKSIEFGHIQQVLQLLKYPSSSACVLPGDIKIAMGKDEMVLSQLDRTSSSTPSDKKCSHVSIQVPGDTRFDPGKVTMRARVEFKTNQFSQANPNQAFMDFDAVGSRVEMRFYHSGDRFWPLGAPGGKKLKSWFIDQKIPREKRSEIPILTDSSGDIIWVYGHQISEKVKIRPDTQNVLYLEGLE
jgi:tRNA(Ile)-lysidine synthase